MYPLVHYYELKIELIELQKKYERGRSNSYQKRAGYGSSIHY